MKMAKEKNIGTDTKKADKECNDNNCPFHGSLRCRGRIFVGTVTGTKMHKTATVEWARRNYLQKYERYEKRRTRLKAHNPECVGAKDGDTVSMIECRPLSKTKNFVIVQKTGSEKGFKSKMEAREAAKAEKPEEKKADAKSTSYEGASCGEQDRNLRQFRGKNNQGIHSCGAKDGYGKNIELRCRRSCHGVCFKRQAGHEEAGCPRSHCTAEERIPEGRRNKDKVRRQLCSGFEG